jgi:hypothetical protein
MVLQLSLLGDAPSKPTVNTTELPRPVHDWALAFFILLTHPKGVTVFDAMSKYGMVKFQERLNEILVLNPHIVSKTMVKVPKRLGRIVDVMQYKITDRAAAFDLYMNQINKKGGSKSLRVKDN